jgi:hypothetical protein
VNDMHVTVPTASPDKTCLALHQASLQVPLPLSYNISSSHLLTLYWQCYLPRVSFCSHSSSPSFPCTLPIKAFFGNLSFDIKDQVAWLCFTKIRVRSSSVDGFAGYGRWCKNERLDLILYQEGIYDNLEATWGCKRLVVACTDVEVDDGTRYDAITLLMMLRLNKPGCCMSASDAACRVLSASVVNHVGKPSTVFNVVKYDLNFHANWTSSYCICEW